MLSKLILAVLCFLVVGCGETIDARQLNIDNGLFYKKGENSPFTGLVENFHPGYGSGVSFYRINPESTKKCTAHFKKGMLNGNVECFSNNNERIALIEIEEGHKHGKEAIWDASSGNLLYEVEFKNNVKHGKEIVYDRLGKNLVEESIYSNNKLVTSKQWNSSGELTKNMTYSDTGINGFSVNNGGQASYYDLEKMIFVLKTYSFKKGYEEPAWSSENRYFGNMDGIYVRSVSIFTQRKTGPTTSGDTYDENGNLEGNTVPNYTTVFGLDSSYINELSPKSFR